MRFRPQKLSKSVESPKKCLVSLIIVWVYLLLVREIWWILVKLFSECGQGWAIFINIFKEHKPFRKLDKLLDYWRWIASKFKLLQPHYRSSHSQGIYEQAKKKAFCDLPNRCVRKLIEMLTVGDKLSFKGNWTLSDHPADWVTNHCGYIQNFAQGSGRWDLWRCILLKEVVLIKCVKNRYLARALLSFFKDLLLTQEQRLDDVDRELGGVAFRR